MFDNFLYILLTIPVTALGAWIGVSIAIWQNNRDERRKK